MIAPTVLPAQDTGAVHNWQGNGFRLETSALPQDQTVAFFLARGFDGETARLIAREGCIFRSAIGSYGLTGGGGGVSVDLSGWRILTEAGEKRLRTREGWAKALGGRAVDPAAAIALEWALFPTTQSFGPDDYNWGLLSFALPRGARFDLEFSWHYDGADYTQRFTGMECSK